ncbi:hypothetical protein LQR31_06795 [Chromobacterium vaccinii]|uniref:hypothetical protein n=1 Tax=Chromobacterium vaccinii TaxID=1108595 RepID=UPI001E360F11|nr:hypothetical protein [Chromobacterium vaccinii]MCD4484180.1 hypothetical protein [Chromobacterium vaccinii]
MNGLSFFAKIIESLAWPITIIIVLYNIKPHIPEILRLLKKFKVGSVELELEQSAKKLDEKEKPIIQEINQILEKLPSSTEPKEQKELSDQLKSALHLHELIENEKQRIIKDIRLQNIIYGYDSKGELSEGRKAVLKAAAKLIGPENIANAPTDEVIKLFNSMLSEARKNPTIESIPLRLGGLKGLQSAGIVNDACDLTNLGVIELKLLAREMQSNSTIN